MYWLFFAIFLFFSGCASPHLSVNDGDDIGIMSDRKSVSVAMEKSSADILSLDGVSVNRSLYVSETSRTLVYERARTMPPYAFSYDVAISLGIIFESSNVRQIARVGNLGFYALQFRDGGQLLYVVAENENKKGIAMLYGLAKAQVGDILSTLGARPSAGFDAMEEGLALPHTPAAFMSRWNPKMIILDGLLRRTGGGPRMNAGAR